MKPRFLLRHLGNMGDLVFFVPPVLAALKRHYPQCHITLVTAWGFKDRAGRWGKRNQGGFSLHLLLTNPHIDQLVHWHDTDLSLAGDICVEDGQRLPTWSRAYYDVQKASGQYDGVFELDFGLTMTDNPVARMFEAVGLPDETDQSYALYLTAHDQAVGAAVIHDYAAPRIVLLEGLAGTTTRGWDPGKVPALERAILEQYGVPPVWFGAGYPHWYEGRPLSLRENIATLTQCDVAIGVLSGPLHFAAAVGLPTLTLYCDQPLHRTIPAIFQNPEIADAQRHHRTVLGPTGWPQLMLKNDEPSPNLTPAEAARQGSQGWTRPGRQATKTCLAVITVEEIMHVLGDMLP